MMRRLGERARAGFTLVEVLITVLIISGIMVAITQVLNAARISRDTIHNIQETQLAGPAIMDLIERDLRALFTYDLTKKGMLRVQNRVLLGRDADSLDFIATTDNLNLWETKDKSVRSDYNEVGYRLRPNPRDDDLLELYRREGFGVDEEPFEGGLFTFLHDGVKHFDVQVYNEDGPDADALEDWNPELEEQQGVPLRLEILLTLELAPRINKEQLTIAPVEQRTVNYRRVIRFPATQMLSLETAPIPVIPAIEPPKVSSD
jgi:type II secretion system protein J